MIDRRLLVLSGLFTAAIACSSPSNPAADVAEVVVTPTSPSVDVGLTVQFTATALDAGGEPVAGVTPTWSSSATGKATVDGNGLATGIEVGVTSITASVGGVSGSQPLLVQASQCTSRVDVILAAGEFQSYPGNQCLLLPSGASGNRYRVAVMRPTQIADSLDAPNVTLRIDPVLAAEMAPIAVPQSADGPNPAPDAEPGTLRGLDGTRFVADQRIREGTRQFHHALRERERAQGLQFLDPAPVRPQLVGPALVDPPARAEMYLDLDCSETQLRPVIRIGFDDDLVIYQDSVQWDESPMSASAANEMLSYHADYVKDMIPQYWGAPSDIDANERIIVVTTPSLPESAAAAVYSGDFVTPTQCASSNQGEVVYFSEEIIANLVESDPSYLALGVLAHEIKHVVSLYHAVRRGSFHPTWIEEGSAEVSQVMSSRIAWAATGGVPLGDRITGQDIVAFVNGPAGGVTPELWGIVGELADLIVNMSTQPNSLITNPIGRNDFHSFYAASWHWHRFIGDAWGDASTPLADSTVFRTLTDSSSASGVPGLMQITGRTFDQLFEDIVVATSMHSTPHTSPRAFSTWEFLSATDIFTSPAEVSPLGIYPWPVTTTATGPTSYTLNAPFSQATFTSTMGPSGVRYHDFVSQGQGLGAQILVTGAASGRIVVTRLN